jgi:hypothetical protein
MYSPSNGKEATRDAPGVCFDHDQSYSFMAFMQVHTQLQAAALRLFPGRRLSMPVSSRAQTKFIRAITAARDSKFALKFDVAQVWCVHSPSSYVTPYGFRRALTGVNLDSPSPELDVLKYSSLEILRFRESQSSGKFKLRAMMDAEDILRFMTSEFARKGQHDEIFEDADSDIETVADSPVGPVAGRAAAPVFIKQEPACLEHEPSGTDQKPLPREQGSPRRDFGSSCRKRIREVEQHFETLSEIEWLEDSAGPAWERHKAKRYRLLANAAMKSISNVLFDTNKLVLDTVLGSQLGSQL